MNRSFPPRLPAPELRHRIPGLRPHIPMMPVVPDDPRAPLPSKPSRGWRRAAWFSGRNRCLGRDPWWHVEAYYTELMNRDDYWPRRWRTAWIAGQRRGYYDTLRILVEQELAAEAQAQAERRAA